VGRLLAGETHNRSSKASPRCHTQTHITDPHDPDGSPTLPPTINEVFPVDLPGELRVNGRKIARQAAGLKDKLQTVAISEYLNQKASLDKNTRIHFHKVEQVNLEGN